MKASIEGIGVLGGFGCGLNQLETALTGYPPQPQSISLETSDGSIEIPALLAETSRLTDFVSKRNLRRIGHYIRMALLASYTALEDAGLSRRQGNRMGIIVATGYGATCNTFDFQHSIINNADPCGSPTVFANSVHNAAAANISIFLKEMGPNLSLSHYDMSIPSAFVTALQWLEEKRVDTVLVGGVDEYCKVLGYYWHCQQHPDSRARGPVAESDIIGEGACFFVLSRNVDDPKPYGVIETVRLGHGRAARSDFPENTVFYLNVDGYSECDQKYATVVPPAAPVATHTHIFGGTPIGMGFEIAIAALSQKSGRIFASAEIDRGLKNGGQLIRRRQDLKNRRICCLKLGAGDAYGWITLSQR